MIEWLDQFVDTRAKRRHLLYLIALFACILLVLPYLFLGLRLLQLSDYPSVFALLKEPLISQTYVSRIILDTISLASFSFTKAITILLKELRPFEVVTALLFLLVFPAVEKKRSTTVVLSAALLAAGGIFFCTWQGLSSAGTGSRLYPLHRRNFVCSWRVAIMLSILLYTQAAEILLSGIADTGRRIGRTRNWRQLMIKTKRLSIQPFQEADCTGMVNLLCNEEIKKTFMIPDFATKSMAERLFHQFKEWSYEEARYERGIYLGDQLIGFVNTVEAEKSCIELGYVIHPAHHNHGYATEMLQAVIADLFEKGYHEICAGAFQENTASCRVMEKCGMKRIQKTAEVDYRGHLHTCVYYRIRK